MADPSAQQSPTTGGEPAALSASAGTQNRTLSFVGKLAAKRVAKVAEPAISELSEKDILEAAAAIEEIERAKAAEDADAAGDEFAGPTSKAARAETSDGERAATAGNGGAAAAEPNTAAANADELRRQLKRLLKWKAAQEPKPAGLELSEHLLCTLVCATALIRGTVGGDVSSGRQQWLAEVTEAVAAEMDDASGAAATCGAAERDRWLSHCIDVASGSTTEAAPPEPDILTVVDFTKRQPTAVELDKIVRGIEAKIQQLISLDPRNPIIAAPLLSFLAHVLEIRQDEALPSPASEHTISLAREGLSLSPQHAVVLRLLVEDAKSLTEPFVSNHNAASGEAEQKRPGCFGAGLYFFVLPFAILMAVSEFEAVLQRTGCCVSAKLYEWLKLRHSAIDPPKDAALTPGRIIRRIKSTRQFSTLTAVGLAIQRLKHDQHSDDDDDDVAVDTSDRHHHRTLPQQQQRHHAHAARPVVKPQAADSSDKVKRCFKCGQTGHKKVDCPKKNK